MEKSTKNRIIKKPDYYSEEFKWQVVQEVLSVTNLSSMSKTRRKKSYKHNDMEGLVEEVNKFHPLN